MFRLLPMQVLLAAVGAVNGIISGLFASNYIGADAMSAVQLFAPVTQLLSAVNVMLVGGSQILCGQYMGRNQTDRTQHVFSLDLLIAAAVAGVTMLVLFAGSLLNLTQLFVSDSHVRLLFNHYIEGQAVGILPLMLGQQLAAFLSLENRVRRTTVASLAFILVNLVLNYLFIAVLGLGAFGLALASSLGLWVFFLIQMQYFMTDRAMLRFKVRGCRHRDAKDIVRVGLPGSLSQGYQTARRLIVNGLILAFVGSIGLSAFGAIDSFLCLIWALPNGMLAVSRMMMSISIGEEDRKTLVDVIRIMLRRFVPMMTAIAVLLAVCAVPLARLYYKDMASEVFGMTVWGFRILPFCMPLSVIYMHFVCYGQEMNRHLFVHLMSALDGVVCVAGFSALLIPVIGMNSVFIANVLNGTVTTLVIIGYAWFKNRRLPRSTEELMVIPDSFGVPDDQRMDLSVLSAEEVVTVSQRVQSFCEEQGIDERRAMMSALFMEEMAGNVVEHGFVKDRKKHSVDVRVVRKEDGVILRIRDDCVPFDPAERRSMMDPEDPARGVGIRLVYGMAEHIEYQSILGLNVLTIRI